MPSNDSERRRDPTVGAGDAIIRRVAPAGRYDPAYEAAMSDPQRSAPGGVATEAPETAPERSVVFDVDDLAVYYAAFRAVAGVTLPIREHEITAFIGPSGCGKTTVLRCFNRMNDLIEGCRVEGGITYHG